MHKIFGTKEDKEYVDRMGAYIIPVRGNEVGIVETPKGYFHPIQSYYVGKLLDKVAELIEPDHVFKFVKVDEIGNKIYLEMQRWAIVQAIAH